MKKDVEELLLGLEISEKSIPKICEILKKIEDKKERDYLDALKKLCTTAEGRDTLSSYDLEWFRKLAAFNAKRGKLTRAYDIVKRVMEIAEKFPENSREKISFRLFYMMISYELNKRTEVIKQAKELLGIEKFVPEDLRATYYNDLGLVASYFEIGKDPVELLEKAMKYPEDFAGSLLAPYNLTEYYYYRGDFEKALNLVTSLKKKAFDYLLSKCAVMELKCFLALSEIEKAENVVKELEKMNSENPERLDMGISLVFLGYYYVSRGDIDKAEEYVRWIDRILEREYTPYLYGESQALKAEILNAQGESFKAIEVMIEAFEILRKEKILSPHVRKYLKSALFRLWDIFKKLVNELRQRDDYTASHTLRVSYFAYSLARHMNYSTTDLFYLIIGGMLHDYGKIKVPLEILNKKGKLDPEELKAIRKHPVYGAEFLEGLKFPDLIRHVVLMHHERIDGKGYPLGLKNGEIPEVAQIVAIADIFDALTTDRPYRKALSKEEAVKYLLSLRGQLVEDHLLNNFAKMAEMIQPRNYRIAFEEIWRETIEDLFEVVE